jgi:hypothetical protein
VRAVGLDDVRVARRAARLGLLGSPARAKLLGLGLDLVHLRVERRDALAAPLERLAARAVLGRLLIGSLERLRAGSGKV